MLNIKRAVFHTQWTCLDTIEIPSVIFCVISAGVVPLGSVEDKFSFLHLRINVYTGAELRILI